MDLVQGRQDPSLWTAFQSLLNQEIVELCCSVDCQPEHPQYQELLPKSYQDRNSSLTVRCKGLPQVLLRLTPVPFIIRSFKGWYQG